MADDDLIDTYLLELRAALRWRADADELVDEAHDHLRTCTERRIADGVDPSQAQIDSIDAFGHPALVARAHAVSRAGRLAVPTGFTHGAGVAGVIAGLAWLAVPVLWWFSDSIDSEVNSQRGYMVSSVVLLCAIATTLWCSLGLRSRHGGELGPLATIGVMLIAIAVLLGMVAWAVTLWMSVLGVGLALVGGRTWVAGRAPRWAATLFSLGILVGLAVWVAARALRLGDVDSWGDYSLPTPLALGVGCTLVGIGSIGLGTWMAREQPVDIELLTDTKLARS